MKIKKILACAAAASLAVSALAATASAEFDYAGGSIPVYNAIITVEGVTGQLHSALALDDTQAANNFEIKVPADSTITAVQATFLVNNVSEKDKAAGKVKEESFDVAWEAKQVSATNTVTLKSVTGDIFSASVKDADKPFVKKMNDGADYSAKFTIAVKTTKEAYKENKEATNVGVNDVVKGVITPAADTTQANSVSGTGEVVLKASKDLAQAMSGKEVSLKLSFKDAYNEDAPVIVSATTSAANREGKNDNKNTTGYATITKGAKEVTIVIPATVTYIKGEINVDAGTLTPEAVAGAITIALPKGVEMNGAVLTNITVGAAPTPAETTAAETTAAPAETTAAPAETTAAPATTTAAPAATTAAPVNNGGTSNEDKNQPTGLAIAVVPAVIAAAGAIVAKKRK